MLTSQLPREGRTDGSVPCRWLNSVMWSWDDTSSMASCLFFYLFLFLMRLFLFNMFVLSYKLRTLYAIRTANAADWHLLYAPRDVAVLSSVQMIATTRVVVASWLSVKPLSNHSNLNENTEGKKKKKRFYFTKLMKPELLYKRCYHTE